MTRKAGNPVWRLKWPISVTKISISSSVGTAGSTTMVSLRSARRVNGKPALVKVSRLGSGA